MTHQTGPKTHQVGTKSLRFLQRLRACIVLVGGDELSDETLTQFELGHILHLCETNGIELTCTMEKVFRNPNDGAIRGTVTGRISCRGR